MRATGRVLAIATVVGALAGVADVVINWNNSHRHVDPEGTSTPTASLSSKPGEESDPPPSPSPTPQHTVTIPPRRNDTGGSEDPPPPPHRDRPPLPLDFTLRDGEQRTFA